MITNRLSPQLIARLTGALYLVIFFVAPSGAASATPPRVIVTLTCDTLVAFLLFDLLKPVSARLSLLAALFRIAFVAVMAVTSLRYFGDLPGLEGSRSAHAFLTGYLVALMFFGVHIFLIGILIVRSTIFPRWLGVLLVVVAPTYVINSAAHFLVGELRNGLQYAILGSWLLAEGALTTWLLLMGAPATPLGRASADFN